MPSTIDSWRDRISPSVLIGAARLLGGLMLASVASYFAAIAMSFSSFFPELAKEFLPRIILFVYVPLAISVVYFYVRVQLGRWLLEQGAIEQAREWCEPRLDYNFWLRGKREVLIQRVVMAQVSMRQLDYVLAESVLWRAPEVLPSGARELVELARWRAEWALRSDNLLRVKKAHDEVDGASRPRVDRAALIACMAERAMRSGQAPRCRELLEEARWVDPTSRRAELVEVLLEAREGRVGAEKLLHRLDSVRGWADEQIPGRGVELGLLRCELLGELGRGSERDEEMARVRALIEDGVVDRRSELLFQDIEERERVIQES